MTCVERPLLLVVVAALGVVGAGCGSGEAPPPAPATTAPTPAPPAATPGSPTDATSAQAVAEAEQIFQLRCATCHGEGGAGDGPGSAGLSPRPRDFQDPTWQASVSDEHLSAIILMGGVAVGMSPTMPGNPDLQSKPEVVKALVAHLRSLGRS